MTMSCIASQSLTREPTDETLMLAVRHGSLDAFGTLVERHQQGAWRVAVRFLGDATEAQDVAQEAFLRVLAAAPRYKTSASFRTFLYRIVTHLCLDWTRKHRPLVTSAMPDFADRLPAPLDAAITKEQAQRIQRALAALPGKQRMALVLRYYEGLGYADIASALGVTAKAAERLLARGRSALESQLADLLD